MSQNLPNLNERRLSIIHRQNSEIREITRGTAEKAHLALNKLAMRENSYLAPDITKHPETAEVIKTVLTHINDTHVERKKRDALDLDPHEDNPTAIINQEELSRVMMVRLARSDSNWLDCAVVWCIASLTAARYKSVEQLKTGKMIIIKNLPPHGIEMPHDGRPWDSARQVCDYRMLGFLVPPCDQIKKPKTNKCQERKTECLGAYRHKRFERCMAGICGFALLGKMNEVNISFMKNIPKGCVKWNLVPLFERKYTTVRNTFKEAMADAGVPEWGKVTHMRKAATTFLTAQGLAPDVVKMMTKHKVEVFIQSYICELSIPVCVCLAGFLPNKVSDKYFIPRSLIGLPGNMSVDEVTNLLFPGRLKWIEEFNSVGGDKSKGAEHFLFEVLLFLSEVICQDGIFWVRYFPNNQATRKLLARLENKTGTQHYIDWAKNKRKEVEEILRGMEDHQATINFGERGPESGILYDDIIRERRELHRERIIADEQRRQLNNREQELNARELAVNTQEMWLRGRQEILLQPFPQLQEHQQQAQAVGAQQQGLVLPRPTVVPPSQLRHNNQQAPQSDTARGMVHTEQEDTGEMTMTRNLCLLRTNANDAIKPTILTLNAYKSLENLVNKKRLHLHDVILSGKRMKKDDWSDSLRDPNNWSRLKVLYQRIDDRQREADPRETMEEAAQWLDRNERMFQHLNMNQYLKSESMFGGKYAGTKRK